MKRFNWCVQDQGHIRSSKFQCMFVWTVSSGLWAFCNQTCNTTSVGVSNAVPWARMLMQRDWFAIFRVKVRVRVHMISKQGIRNHLTRPSANRVALLLTLSDNNIVTKDFAMEGGSPCVCCNLCYLCCADQLNHKYYGDEWNHLCLRICKEERPLDL